MSENDYPDSDQERLEAEAVTWMVCLTSGETTEDDRRATESWRRQSPAHQRAFEKAFQLWNGMEALRGVLVTTDKPREVDIHIPQMVEVFSSTWWDSSRRQWWLRSALAAAIASLVLVFSRSGGRRIFSRVLLLMISCSRENPEGLQRE